ncbi:MAG: glycine oxidase ThiO [Acidobacteria bacterium]|nr:glycine oxidase ThiO [Acidobacteriota bacterium]
MNYDVLIIGGGVIGLSIARELASHRVGRIAVVERGGVGREASFAAAGMLAPSAENETADDFYRLCDASRKMYPLLARELAAETGIDVELDRSGTLYGAFTGDDARHLNSRFERQTAVGIAVERLSASDTIKAEPHISPTVRESLFFANDWQVENRRLLTALEASVRGSNIGILENMPVDSLILDKGRVCGVESNASTISAGTTVLATGAWTSLIKIAGDAVPLEVKPIRGQMIGFSPPDRMFRRVIYSPRGYVVPRADGRVLVGATVEDAGFDKSVTGEAVGQLKECAFEIAPLLVRHEILEKWAGLRPFAADGLPVIGPVPGFDGLTVATAHYRNGILLAPITAKIVAENIVDGSGTEYFDIYGPKRLFEKGFNANA